MGSFMLIVMVLLGFIIFDFDVDFIMDILV